MDANAGPTALFTVQLPSSMLADRRAAATLLANRLLSSVSAECAAAALIAMALLPTMWALNCTAFIALTLPSSMRADFGATALLTLAFVLPM